MKKRRNKLKRGVALLLAILSLGMPGLMATSCIIGTLKAATTNTVKKQLPIYCVDTGGVKKVAITFDAAWGNEDAEVIREILNKYNVKATFFMVGDWMRKYPELVKELAADGHDMANHSNKHPHVNQMNKEAIKQDIMAAHEEIKILQVRIVIYIVHLMVSIMIQFYKQLKSVGMKPSNGM